MKPNARLALAIVMLCFFVSGMAGLIYQIVWARYLALFLGHTSYAVVAVLVAFMGGLALGNAWFGIRADRSAKPLALYGWLEIGIGVYALVFPVYYAFCHASFVSLAQHLQPGSTGLLALKFGFSLLTILIPTFLMGATFPVLAKFVTRSLSELRERVAALYCINSAGAVAGCLVADFWWIPAFGLGPTVFGGAILNLVVGVIALYLSRQMEAGKSPSIAKPAAASGAADILRRRNTSDLPAEGEVPPSPHPLPLGEGESMSALEKTGSFGSGSDWLPGSLSQRERAGVRESASQTPHASKQDVSAEERFTATELRLAIIGIGLSGFVAMLYEVAWTRLLGLALGSSTHAFSLMLITFITGIAAGAWIIYLWKNLRRTLEAFAWAELALAATLLASMFFYQYLPYWFVKLAALLARRPEAYPLYELLQALICFSVMFIPTVCLGMTLPLVSRIATQELASTGRSVGRVFAVNTLGTVLGAIVTGLWLMPAVGLAWTFAIGLVTNALIGLAILQRHRMTRQRMLAVPLFAVALAGLIGFVFDHDWKRIFSVGLWRSVNLPPTMEAYRNMAQADELKFHRDGAGSTVTVVSRVENGKEHMGLKINGKADASTGSDVATQRLLGHIPMLLRPESQHALVVGLGSGMTCSAVARHPTIQQIDAVEISPDVVEASKLFAAYNDHFWTNPRVRIVVEDAKSFLKITPKKYDVIISEPSNPWMAGVAGVFSREYYESCAARLKTNGLMVQWVQIYETSDETFNTVLRTFASAFPYLSIWHPTMTDLILVGSSEPYQVDLEAAAKRFSEPAVKADLERIDITQLSVFLAREIVSQPNGLFVTPAEGPVHSDLRPILEFLAQEAFFVRSATGGWRKFDETSLTRPTTLLGQYLQKHPLTEADFKAFGRFYLEQRLPEQGLFRSLLLRWHREKPEATLPIELMAQASDQILTAELEALRLASSRDFLVQHAEKDPEPLRMYASYLMQTHRAHRSVFYLPTSDDLQEILRRLIETNPANHRVYQLHLAELAWDRGDDAVCFQLAQSALDPNIAKGGRINFSIDPSAPRQVLHRMTESLWRAGKLREAWNLCQDAARNNYTGSFPLLDMNCRKIETYVSSMRAESAR